MRLFHDPATPPASVIWIVRLIAITTSLGVISLLGLFGYHAVGRRLVCSGQRSGAITPIFVENSRWGTAEIFVTFFSVLALYLTIVGIIYRRESWTTHGTYALMLAILFKYHCVFLAPVVLFMPLWGGGVSRRRVLANTGRFALFSAWLLLSLTPVHWTPISPPKHYHMQEHQLGASYVQFRVIPQPTGPLYNNFQLASLRI